MNKFLEIQIGNMELTLKNFEDGCKLALFRDDGDLSEKEKIILKEIETSTEQYRKTLLKIKKL